MGHFFFCLNLIIPFRQTQVVSPKKGGMANFSHKALRRESAPKNLSNRNRCLRRMTETALTQLFELVQGLADETIGLKGARKVQKFPWNFEVPWRFVWIFCESKKIHLHNFFPLHPWFIVGKIPFMKKHPILVSSLKEHHLKSPGECSFHQAENLSPQELANLIAQCDQLRGRLSSGHKLNRWQVNRIHPMKMNGWQLAAQK